jgi:CheY-like chemotaxis protein
MNRKVKCIMLVDDNADDNFIHARVIKQSNAAVNVIEKQTGRDALEYLKSTKNDRDTHPDLILLDINMPGMNGWEFLEEYNKLDEQLQSQAIIVMLTTSDNPDHKVKAKATNIASDFRTKPLTKGMLEEILNQYFK